MGNSEVEIEIELYSPFNTESFFDTAAVAVREMVDEIKRAPLAEQSMHCKRPKKIQPDDWECPNMACGNLCFARRKSCNLCGTEKPSDWSSASVRTNVPDCLTSDPAVARPPKHKIGVISTKERLQRDFGPLQMGECFVVWLVPLEMRVRVIYPSVLKSIHATDAHLTLTREVETRQLYDETFCMAFLRGPPHTTSRAIEIIHENAGGRLATDGFEALLDAVERDLRDSNVSHKLLAKLEDVEDVKRTLTISEDLMRGAGLASLLDVLKQWPERFEIHQDDTGDAAVALPGFWEHSRPAPRYLADCTDSFDERPDNSCRQHARPSSKQSKPFVPSCLGALKRFVYEEAEEDVDDSVND